MKAFLLAAGLGTRLRPATDKIPKCLAPINGRPLLAYWVELMARHGITDVLINTHHLAKQVRHFIRQDGLPIHFVEAYEPQLLGSASTLRANREFVAGEKDFFILYADNLTNADLTALLAFHRSRGLPLTIGLFRPEDIRACGVVQTDPSGLVLSIEEKPSSPKSLWASAGLFVANPVVLDEIAEKPTVDMGFDWLPRLVGRVAAVPIVGYLRDVGTLEGWQRAQTEWPEVTRRRT